MAEARTLFAEEIKARLRTDAERMIREEGERYESEISRTADYLCRTKPGRCLVLLSGPSSAGKTTTARKLSQYLRDNGREAYTVSLDDFYRGYGFAPQLPDGSYDYESIEALNLPLLEQCMTELIDKGCTKLPQFDFMTHKPKSEMVELCIPEHAVVIFEGIHALNPLLLEHLPKEAIFRIFINVRSRIYHEDAVLFTRRDLRLVRRMLRDYRFRNSDLENTMDMWRQVLRGEDLYLFPYSDNADVAFDTTQAYEPALLGGELLPLLRQLPSDSRHAETAKRLIDALSVFEPLPVSLLPDDALLKEFVG